MDPVTAKIERSRSFAPASQSEFDVERELAMTIRRHFCELANILNRTAEMFDDTVDGERLRAAASAADRGRASAERLCAKVKDSDDTTIAVRRLA